MRERPDAMGSATKRPGEAAGARLYLFGNPSPMRPGVLAVLRAHGYRPVLHPRGADVVAGWGTRPSGERAARYAARRGMACLRLEDALLRSAGLGLWGAPPLGLIADPLGVYYDAAVPSLIEERLESSWAMDVEDRASATALLGRFVTLELTKYAMPRVAGTPVPSPDPLPAEPFALVVDQTAGDESIRRGGAGPETFAAMLREAAGAARHVVIRTHPDVLTGRKRGHLGPEQVAALGLDPARIRHDAGADPFSTLRRASSIHVATSLLGFEARMRGLRVEVHGLPFYAGWGEPGDREVHPRRTRRREPAEIFAAAYRDLAFYLDPHTGRACDLAHAMEVIHALRLEAERRAVPTRCFGMRGWKHDFVGLHLGLGAPGAFPPGHVTHHRRAADAIEAARREGGRVGYWAAKTLKGDARAVAESGLPSVRIEDGFLRSRGLGAHFTFPGSLALDGRGIYYDPARPSDLEAIIDAGGMADALLARARALIEAYRTRGLSKYNLRETKPDPALPKGRALVVALGQVEDDASIRAGAIGEVRTNAALIERARADHPDAWLVYRPHPDVERGLRRGRVPQGTLGQVDAVAAGTSLPRLLGAAERVHVITSLGGLEALMQGASVTCHGAPFYAGWGLTEDAVAVPRRTRRATLPEVVAATYLAYPSTVDPLTRLFTSPERLAERIESGTGALDWNAFSLLLRREWGRLSWRLGRR